MKSWESYRPEKRACAASGETTGEGVKLVLALEKTTGKGGTSAASGETTGDGSGETTLCCVWRNDRRWVWRNDLVLRLEKRPEMDIYVMFAVVGVVNFGYFQLCAWLYKYHNLEKEDIDSSSPSSAR
ncbi:hypothetical protein MRB53_026635 [Persea americana]|uniref:Uncharacterized protein n=1 Tax=Persea americana TaxID=3435 RepID=A0ACC2LJU7_PERAE|nr:hypothetical protein MRB53_026635 [Persea americana]